MDGDKLQELKNEVQQVQQELQATQAKLQQLHQRLYQLQPEKESNFFKTPYQPHFSLENFIGLRLIHLVGIVVLGGLLWWAAWPTSPLTILAFVAFIPLLFVDGNTVSGRRFFWLAYLHMFTWNLLTTWWIYNASFAGAALAIVLNSLIMCGPWLLMRSIKKNVWNNSRLCSACYVLDFV